MKDQQEIILHFSKLIICYIAILVFNGYVYGGEAVSELVPFAKYLADSELYLNDYHIQQLSNHFPNVRYTLSLILAKLNANEFWTFFLHFASCIALFSGLTKLGKFLIKNEWLPYFFLVVVCMTPIQDTNLGTNSIFYNVLNTNLVSNALMVWIFYFWLTRMAISYALLMVTAIVIDFISGTQLWVLTILTELIFNLLRRKRAYVNLNKWFWPHFLVLSLAGFWIYYTQTQNILSEEMKELVFDFFKFRYPIDYFPSNFSTTNFLIFTGLFFNAVFIFRYNLKLTIFTCLVLLSFGLYAYMVEVQNNYFFLKAELFRPMIWIKILGVAALFRTVRLWIDITFLKQIEPIMKNMFFVSIILFAANIGNPTILFPNKAYMTPWRDLTKLFEINIAERTKILTDKDALVVIPPNFSYFRTFSERSTLLTFNDHLKQPEAIQEWLTRSNEVYNSQMNQNNTFENNFLYATENYPNISDKTIQFLIDKYCVNYIVLPIETETRFVTLTQNEAFKLVVLKKPIRRK